MPVLQFCLFAFAVGCWGVAFRRQWLNRGRGQWIGPPPRGDRSYVAAVVGFVGAIAILFALAELYEYAARANIAAFCAPGVESVTVDGKPFAPADDLVAQIAAPRQPQAHHSHPTKPLNVRLTGHKGTLELVLSRDNDDPHEYWLFYPRYTMTKVNANAVGHVFTDQLDNY